MFKTSDAGRVSCESASFADPFIHCDILMAPKTERHLVFQDSQKFATRFKMLAEQPVFACFSIFGDEWSQTIKTKYDDFAF